MDVGSYTGATANGMYQPESRGLKTDVVAVRRSSNLFLPHCNDHDPIYLIRLSIIIIMKRSTLWRKCHSTIS